MIPNPFKLKPGTADDSHQFKPMLSEIVDTPTSPLGRTVFWLVLGVFLFFVLWTCFAEMDIVISARGKVMPFGEVKVLQPLETGVVSQINVKEGDFIRKGQPLMVIDPSATAPSLQSSKKNLEYMKLEQARLQATSRGGGFNPGVLETDAIQNSATQRELYDASHERLQKQLTAKQKELQSIAAQTLQKKTDLAHVQSMLKVAQDREKRLSEVKDIIAKDEYDKVANEVLEYQTKSADLQYELQQLAYRQQQTREEMAYLRASFKADSLKELSEKEKQITALQADVEETTFKNARQTLTSPVDGYVQELSIHTVGGVVTPAEKLIFIVPVDTPLVVEAVVLNKDIGFVKNNMDVAVKIDTFDFQKYGTLRAKVTQIPKDSTEDEKQGPVYKVLITPIDKFLMVEGKKEPLTTGLSLTSEIKVGKRRVIEFFIYPLIKHLHEGMSVR